MVGIYRWENTEKELTRKLIKELITNGGAEERKWETNDINVSDGIVIKNGKFGVYINYDKKNIALKYSKHFKSLNKSHENLTKEECDVIIREYLEYKNKKSKWLVKLPV